MISAALRELLVLAIVAHHTDQHPGMLHACDARDCRETWIDLRDLIDMEAQLAGIREMGRVA